MSECVFLRAGKLPARLRKIEVERVDFLGAQIANKETRAVGSEATPFTNEWVAVPAQVRYIQHEFGAGLTDFDAPKCGMIAEGTIVIQIISVGRPSRKTDATCFINPLRPFLSLEIVEHEPLGICGKRGEVPAIGGPSGTEQAFRTRHSGGLAGFQIEDVDGSAALAPKSDSRALGGPTGIHFDLIFAEQFLRVAALGGDQKHLQYLARQGRGVHDLRAIGGPARQRDGQRRICKLEAIGSVSAASP